MMSVSSNAQRYVPSQRRELAGLVSNVSTTTFPASSFIGYERVHSGPEPNASSRPAPSDEWGLYSADSPNEVPEGVALFRERSAFGRTFLLSILLSEGSFHLGAHRILTKTTVPLYLDLGYALPFAIDLAPSCENNDLGEAVIDPKERLLTIRLAFGFSMSQLAQVMRVSRPTLYSWEKGHSQPRQDKDERLSIIHRLALFWIDNGGWPLGGRAKLKIAGRPSLLDLMSQSRLSEEDVRNALLGLLAKTRKRGTRRISVRNRPAGSGLDGYIQRLVPGDSEVLKDE